MSAPTTRSPVFHSHRSAHGLETTVSALSSVPLVQAHLMVHFPLRDATELAVFDVLSAAWTDLPVCERFERSGGAVGVSRNQQWLVFSLTCPSSSLPLLADTLAALPAAVYDDELVRTAVSRSAHQASLTTAAPAVFAARQLWERFYGHVPTFADPAPDPGLVRSVTPRDVADAHARHVLPSRSRLVLVGDVDPDRAAALLDAALASWGTTTPGDGHDGHRCPPRTAERGLRERTSPGGRQAHLRLAAPSSPRSDLSRFAAVQVASLILGGSFSSRITTELRERRGLAYRATCVVSDHLDHDTVVVEADVNPSAAGAAVEHLTRLLEDFADDGPTGAELDTAVGHVTGKYALGLGSQNGRAACVVSHLSAGLPLSAVTDLPRHIAALTPREVRAAARHYRPDGMTGVVCTPGDGAAEGPG